MSAHAGATVPVFCRRAPALLALVVLLLAWPRAGTEAARAAGNALMPVYLQPSDQQGRPVRGPGYFAVILGAGTQMQLYALVGNTGHRTTRIRLAPVDATSGVYGGISYALPQQGRRGVGGWISLGRTRITLAPNRGVVVPFLLRVPRGTPPGQYVGAVTGFVPTPTTRRTRFSAIRVQPRRVVAVVVTVPGPQQRGLAVMGEVARHRPNAVYLITDIRNRGNVLLAGQGHLWLWKVGHRKPVVSAPLRLDTTVPHTTVHYPVQWARQAQPGSYRFRVLVWWQGGKTMRDGTLRVQ